MPPTSVLALFALMWISGGIPKHPTAEDLFTKGVAASFEHEHDKAISYYNVALERGLTEESRAMALCNRGTAYYNKNDFDKAIADFNACILLLPGNTIPLFNRGLVYRDKHDDDHAIADFEEVLRLDSRNYGALCGRAFCFYHKGDVRRALDDYTAAIHLSPSSTDAYAERAAVYHDQGDHEKAAADYGELAALFEKRINEGEKRAAKMSSEPPRPQAAEMQSKDMAQACNALAWLLATCPEESIRNAGWSVDLAMRACVAGQWKIPAHIDTLAAAYAESGDFADAVKFQQWYVTLTPKDKGGRVRLELYQARKPYREARPENGD